MQIDTIDCEFADNTQADDPRGRTGGEVAMCEANPLRM